MVDRGRGHHLRALIAGASRVTALSFALSTACASAPEPSREPTYVDRVQARVRAALEAPSYRLRYNPAAPCGCPPFEVKLGEVWQRVEIGGEEDDPVIVALGELARQSDPGARDRRVFEVEGQLQDLVALCGRGALYASLAPTALLGEVDRSAP